MKVTKLHAHHAEKMAAAGDRLSGEARVMAEVAELTAFVGALAARHTVEGSPRYYYDDELDKLIAELRKLRQTAAQ